MFRRYGSFFFWILGALIIIGAFYTGTARLWKATEEARASGLEKDVVSAAMGDLAEGNLIRFGSTLSKLQREGQIRYAEVRQVGRDSSTIFRTNGSTSANDVKLADFTCASPRRLFDAANGGIGLVTILPTKIAGSQCNVLLLTADMPQELSRFKNRLLSTMTFFVALVLGLFAFITIIWHRRVLQLEVQNSVIHAERDAAIGRIASQVAHDIRSPLSALDSVLKDLSQLPEEKRVIIRSAVGRIRDIANNVIEKNRAAAQGGGDPLTKNAGTGAPATVQLLSSLVDSLVTEKRLQFRSQLGVEIDSRLDPSSYGLFVKIPAADLKRVLSNLINNAVEALPGKGIVTVRLASVGESVELRVRDNGKGIPPDLLARLGHRGETHGKPGGSGLGLHHSKSSVESWGGTLRIESEPGKGTSVTIQVPRAAAPDWFASGLIITPGAKVVVLDDDTSIHQVWRGRFESAVPKASGVEILHFSTPDELRTWVRNEAPKASAVVYLLDYELLGYSDTGLDLAEELGIGNSTVLVTSRFEEPEVLSNSMRLRSRLIPKPLAGYVPISVESEKAALCRGVVLIDDDALVRMNWKEEAEHQGEIFRSYSSIEDFLVEAGEIDRRTQIYVDANLANGVDGSKESVRIYELGFKDIFLATGHPASKFNGLAHVQGVVGKDPPWSDRSADS